MARTGAVLASTPSATTRVAPGPRARPWVDRLATRLAGAALHRSVGALRLAEDPAKRPKSALGFDFDGARFTHVGGKVTFEVVARASGWTSDPALRRIGELVHYIDVGGIPVDEAAGLETMVRGLQAQHDDDDALLAAACPLFDALYAGLEPCAE